MGRFDEEAEAPPSGPRAADGPTSDAPFGGLEHLAAVAIVGRERLVELASAPVSYVWTDIVVAGIIALLAGPSGGGKTTLLFLLLVARANVGEAVRLLGREVTPAPAGQYVVLVEGEHGEGSAARKLVRSCRVLGVADNALDRVVLIARRGVRIGSSAWLDIEKMIAAGLVSDIALDTLARVAPGDANDEREQVAIFDQIAAAIEKAPAGAKPTAWVVAHTRKGEAESLDDVGGSVQRVGQADSVVLVKPTRVDGRVTSSRAVFVKLREEPDEYPVPVEYTVRPDSIVEVGAAVADDRPLEERILDRLALGAQTKNALATALGRSSKDVDDALTTLFSARRIRTTETTVKGRPFKAFALA